MTESDLSEQVRGFIARHITSVVQLETLLLLEDAPAREWTADEVAAALRIDPTWASSQMEGLCQQGLAERIGDAPRYRYAPHDDPTRQAVAALAQAYQERRVTVITLIFSKPPEPPKTDGVRVFADAFRLRKDKETDKDQPNAGS